MNIDNIKFRYLLSKKGVSTRQICKDLNLSINTLYNWLYKGVKTPLYKAMLIAEYLETDLEDVFYCNEVSL